MLRRNEIEDAIREREIIIDPFDKDNLTPNGYILTVEKVTVPKVHWTVREGYVAIGKLTRFVVKTQERVSLGHDLTASLTLYPKLSAKGIIASFPRLDSGHDTEITLSAFNSSIRTIDLAHGEEVAEIVFERISGIEEKGKDLHAPTLVQKASTPISPLKSLHLDPRDGGHPCLVHSCTVCCHGTEMPLTNSDRKRIEALGYTDFWIEHDGWMTLRNIDGRCMFLEDLRCSIYKDRPVGCTFYPAVHSTDEDTAIPDDECPYHNEFGITKTLDKDLKILVDTVQRERRQRRIRKGY